MYVVIRAGGIGKRLWPLSRRIKPKQFHRILSSKTLLRETYERMRALIESPENVFVSCAQDCKALVSQEIPEIPSYNIIAEPASCNTGPAMCLEAVVLSTRIPDDEVVCSVPSDDYIGNPEKFCAAMREAAIILKENPQWLYSPCVNPELPDTGYSYLRQGEELIPLAHGMLSTVTEWIEKPERVLCESLLSQNDVAVHTGMYMYVGNQFNKLWSTLHPLLYRVCTDVAAGHEGAEVSFRNLPPDSVETLIARRTGTLVMSIVNDVQWSDVGKWSKVKQLIAPGAANITRGTVVLKNTSGSLIYGQKNKPIAIIGLKDCVVVDTGDCVLVASLDRVHEVSGILNSIDAHFR